MTADDETILAVVRDARGAALSQSWPPLPGTLEAAHERIAYLQEQVMIWNRLYLAAGIAVDNCPSESCPAWAFLKEDLTA